MKMGRNKCFTPFVAVIMTLGLVFCLVLNGWADVLDKKPIGTVNTFEINDLTGPTSDSCAPHHNIIWSAIRDLNEKGGIVYDDPKTGKKERVIVNFKWGDNKAQAGPVPTLYERLISEKPKPVVCFMGSSAAVETVPPWTERDRIVQISGPSGQPGWYPPRWSFVGSPDYPGQACVAAEWAMKDWRKKGHKDAPGWAWFTLDLPFGRAPIRPESEAYIKNLGFKIVGTWTIPYAAVDTSAQLRAMVAAGADYCYGNLVVLQQQKLMKDITRLGLKDKLQVIACAHGIPKTIIEVAGDAAEGMVGIGYVASPEEMDKPGVKLVKELSKKYKLPFNSDTLLGYTMYLMIVPPIKRALETVGYPVTGDDVFKAITSSKGVDLMEISPTMYFTDNNRRGYKHVHMRKVKDGKIVRITEDIKMPDTRPGGPLTPKK